LVRESGKQGVILPPGTGATDAAVRADRFMAVDQAAAVRAQDGDFQLVDWHRVSEVDEVWRAGGSPHPAGGKKHCMDSA